MNVALRWGLLLASFALWAFALLTPKSVARADNPEEIHVIVHPALRVAKLSDQELEAIYTRSTTRWEDGTSIIPFNLADNNPVRHRFDRAVLRLSSQQVGRFWLDQRIRGLGAPPRQVPDATLLVKVIERLPGSIGYVPASRGGTTAKVIARIVNGTVVAP